jgi:hypothetical protein
MLKTLLEWLGTKTIYFRFLRQKYSDFSGLEGKKILVCLRLKVQFYKNIP